ncbi:helix-turn-helix transcriptional regulator [Lysinibacillus capsici]|uniref:helix-turn-helix transcriptional regulator n=1 Tax=Lysinibacillus capsici TaxID=2115968 RepID=UPI002730F46F|nr:helix-turn-helix transcriptional regulator [Lysinibacillus capsici]MDP1391979.1 helix-turn-helix transcriptional regulator [Lysinibacillus capsici]MDP1412455.1 helix-turn-helix transcriptional regulator [Lysinibacillus capsici]
MGWSMTKPKRKKRNKKINPSEEFRNLKGPKRECLIAARKAKGLTQAQLGKLVGCSTAMIAHLENGRGNPSLDISMELEKVLETHFFELFPDL